ncbi:hypothetical protein CPB83DRAFT_739731, partial [Crepidotus variabilis]
MANHGYINRDGKNLRAKDVSRGLQHCYNLSPFLAAFLSYGGFLAITGSFWKKIDLYGIGKHNRVEHDASLVHYDTPEGQEFAPIQIDHALVDKLIEDVRPSPQEVEAMKATPSGSDVRCLMNAEDVARARIRRENECRTLKSIQQNTARGEMAIILGVFEVKTASKTGVPVEWMKRWIGEERLPEGWKPTHVQGIFDVIKRNKSILAAIEKLRAEEAKA